MQALPAFRTCERFRLDTVKWRVTGWIPKPEEREQTMERAYMEILLAAYD